MLIKRELSSAETCIQWKVRVPLKGLCGFFSFDHRKNVPSVVKWKKIIKLDLARSLFCLKRKSTHSWQKTMTETHNHGFRVLGVAVEGSFGLVLLLLICTLSPVVNTAFLNNQTILKKNCTKLPGFRVKWEDTDPVFLAALHPGDPRRWRETLKGCTETRREQLGLLQSSLPSLAGALTS